MFNLAEANPTADVHTAPTPSRSGSNQTSESTQAAPTVRVIQVHSPSTKKGHSPVERPASRFGSPHRAATLAWSVGNIFGLAAAASAWSSLVDGNWNVLSSTMVAVTFVMLLASGSFRLNMIEGTGLELGVTGRAVSAGLMVALVVVVSFPGLGQPTASHLVTLGLTLGATTVMVRLVGRWILEHLWRRGRLRARALVYGYDDLAQEMAVELALRPGNGVDIVAYIDPALAPAGDGSVTDNLPAVNERGDLSADLLEALAAIGADRLIIGPATGRDHLAQKMARWASLQGMAVHIVPRFHQMGLGFDSMAPDQARGFPLVRLQRSAHPRLSLRLKRLLDIVGSLIGLTLAGPVLVGAAVAVKVNSPGPILFVQERVGQHGRLITVRKFRSMTVGEPAPPGSPEINRVTSVGQWLRRTNIDELPQLLSILVGDMSLVGPRPERPAYVDYNAKRIPDYCDRHRAPVGLTGLAQVSGFRGETSIAERVKYDNLYIDQWCLRSDLAILGRTVAAILTQNARSVRVLELERAIDQAQTSEDPS